MFFDGRWLLPSISEIYLFSEIGPNAILRIFNSIEIIFKKFYEKQNLIVENANWLYSSKIESRQIEFEKIIDKSDFSFLRRIYRFETQSTFQRVFTTKTNFTFIIWKFFIRFLIFTTNEKADDEAF